MWGGEKQWENGEKKTGEERETATVRALGKWYRKIISNAEAHFKIYTHRKLKNEAKHHPKKFGAKRAALRVQQ